jgi:outer membrane protein assembly factor BamB
VIAPLRHRVVTSALAGALVMLSGCAAPSWVKSPLSVFRSETKLAALPELRESVISAQWNASAGNPRLFVFSPAVSDKVIYAAAADGTISALADQGGRSVARIEAKSKLTAGVGAAEDMVVVADAKGFVLAFDNAGRSRWKTAIDGEILASPQIIQGNVIVRTADGRLFALNRTDGKRKWVFTRAAPALTLRSTAMVSASRGVVYAGFPGGKVVAIELDSGRPVWEATISLPRGTTELERVADVAGAPVPDGSSVCAAVYQGRTGCVESLSGNSLWTRDISSADGVAVDAKQLYVVDTDGNVFALDKTTGATVWKQEKLARRDLGTPLLVNNRVLIGDRKGLVHALATDTGDFKGRLSTDGSRINALIANGDRAIAQTEKGAIYAITVR